tara:strand:- start:90 stop:305 length:216 start_codon:yes stop_codon:yes gene_type:complete
MSAEKINISDSNNLPPLATPDLKEEKIKGRVDINNLLARVREEEKKETKINIVFFGLFASLVIVVGIILSF